MKTSLIVLTALLILGPKLAAQTSGQPYLSGGSEFRFQSRQVQPSLVPGVGLEYESHRAQIGALLSKPDWQLSYPFRLSGISLSYHYRLGKPNHQALGLGVLLTTQAYTQEWTQTYWEQTRYVKRKQANKERCSSALISAAYSYQVAKQVALEVKLAAGIYRAQWQMVEGSSEFNSYAPYDDFGLSYRLGLGARYYLKKGIKKGGA